MRLCRFSVPLLLRPLLESDCREPAFPGGSCATAAHENCEVERDRLGLSRQMLAADAGAEDGKSRQSAV